MTVVLGIRRVTSSFTSIERLKFEQEIMNRSGFKGKVKGEKKGGKDDLGDRYFSQ